MKKPIVEFYHFLKRENALNEYAEKIVEPCIPYLKKTSPKSFIANVRPPGFLWSETNQGYSYWFRLNCKWASYCMRAEEKQNGR